MSLPPQIVRIPVLPLSMVNSYLIAGADGCILVDTGLPGSESRIEKTLKHRGLSFRDIKLIVVTHAHVDHAGSAATLRDLSGAPIAAHEGDMEHFGGTKPMKFCPTGWFGRLFLRTPWPHRSYKAFSPDILVSSAEDLDLSQYGIPGTVKHTPGHTSGTISVELATKEALVGDLVASGILLGGIIRTNRAIRPPFEDDPHEVGAALRRLVDSGVKRFYLGHGGPLEASEVQRHAQILLSM